MEHLNDSDDSGAPSNAPSASNPYLRDEVCNAFEQYLQTCDERESRRIMTFGSFKEAHALICDLREGFQKPERFPALREAVQNKSKLDTDTADHLVSFMFQCMDDDLQLASSTMLEFKTDPYTWEDASIHAPDLKWAQFIVMAASMVKAGNIQELHDCDLLCQTWNYFHGLCDSPNGGEWF